MQIYNHKAIIVHTVHTLTMDFKDSIKQLSQKAAQFKDNLLTEEATKTTLVLPFIIALGYDVFNPLEVVPEMDCALVNKKSDKIDYAIMIDNKPIMLIECKQANVNLELHTSQLQKYFAASNAKFGLLTNGIEYRFYTDLDKLNIMDEKHFLVVNILDMTDNDIEQLKKFHKSYYNEGDILNSAQDLKYSTEIRNILSKEIAAPSAEFVRFFTRQVYTGKTTEKALEFFTPIVKNCINDIINDIIQDRLNLASTQLSTPIVEEQPTVVEQAPVEDSEPSDGIITTQEEIDSYNIVRSILCRKIAASKIEFKDCKTYFSVYVKNRKHWICRFYYGPNRKSLCLPQDNYASDVKLEIQYIDDIFNYTEHLEKALDMALSTLSSEI